jgi:hypothetical protein
MQIEFESWITHIIKIEKPSPPIKGYYFGLFETDTNEYIMYLSGSNEFDKDDGDWAFNNDFEPQNKYLSLPEYKDFSWEKVFRIVESVLMDFVKTEIFKNSFLSKAKGIAMGFDDGDVILIFPRCP